MFLRGNVYFEASPGLTSEHSDRWCYVNKVPSACVPNGFVSFLTCGLGNRKRPSALNSPGKNNIGLEQINRVREHGNSYGYDNVSVGFYFTTNRFR